MNVSEISERFASLEKRAERSDTRLRRSERKLRVTWGVSCLSALAMLSIGWHKDAIAQGYGMTLAQAATRIAALETKTASLSTLTDPNTNQPTVRFSGVNVQVVDGTGDSENINGTGNLIIGYNEYRLPFATSTNFRTGSHNLVIGLRNNYSNAGGAVFGTSNTISGAEACVLGGSLNTASGGLSTVSGGYLNLASGQVSTVSGGNTNKASADSSSVSGGFNNAARGDASSVSGGQRSEANGTYSTVSGGNFNKADGDSSTISGGPSRILSTDDGWVAGRFTGTNYTGNFASP